MIMELNPQFAGTRLRPYKTHVGLHFRHEAGRDAYTPGFYLHLEPGACFVGVGLWRPDNPTLRPIRDLMATAPARWMYTRPTGSAFYASWRSSRCRRRWR